jgi:DNA-directed RNA polymerase specialized sigma24 family protein
VVEIVPGKDGVTEALIEQLHQMDDEEFDSNRSFVRFAEVRYQHTSDGDGNSAEDRNGDLADPHPYAQEIIIGTEFSVEFKTRWAGLRPDQQEIVWMRERGWSNVKIAAEIGVTEGAIRKRFKEICEQFMNFRE